VLPKSPFTAEDSQLKYLIWYGLSKPSSARKILTLSSVLACPRTDSTKSPGRRLTELKIIKVTKNNETMPRAILLINVVIIGCIFMSLSQICFWLIECQETYNN